MSACCSLARVDATFLPNCCVVSPQEIQDRIRIIELYAKDRQFADFVRQHQAWVALFAFTFSSKLGDEDVGWTSQQGSGTPVKIFTWRGSGKINININKYTINMICLVGEAVGCWSGEDLLLPRPPPAQPGPEVIRCADNPITASSPAARLHHVFHRGPECQALCGRILGPSEAVNKTRCLLEGIKLFLLLLLLLLCCFCCSVMDTCRENSST